MGLIKSDTALKLADSKTQLRLARQFIGDNDVVRSCINAFVSLARSTTLVMQKESGAVAGLTEWYDNEMKAMLLGPNGPMLKFFNERRVFSVHIGSIVLERVNFAIFDHMFTPDGDAIFDIQQSTGWLFDDAERFGIPGQSSALDLCDDYLLVIDGLVSRWETERAA